MAASGRRLRYGIARILLAPDRLFDFQIDVSASNSGRADGVCRFRLADLSIPAARELSVPLQSDLRPPRGRIGDAVAPCIRSERTAMEGAGRHSGGMAIAARSAPLIPSPRVRRNDCEHSCNDATDWRNIATSQGENYRCVLSPHHNQRSWGYLSNGAEAIEVTSTWLLPW